MRSPKRAIPHGSPIVEMTPLRVISTHCSPPAGKRQGRRDVAVRPTLSPIAVGLVTVHRIVGKQAGRIWGPRPQWQRAQRSTSRCVSPNATGETQSIGHHDQRGAHVGEDGHPHGGSASQRKRHENRLDAQRNGDVLPHHRPGAT